MEAPKAPTGVTFSLERGHFDAFWSTFRQNIIATIMFRTSAKSLITRSQAVARIADRTAKNCRGHVT